MNTTVAQNLPPPPPPPPAPPETEVEEIFKMTEDFPRFPGCEDMRDKQERERCANKKLLTFIYKNIEYPRLAKEAGVEGMVVVSFVVERDGEVSNIKVVRGIGYGCDEEAVRVVNLLNSPGIKWAPGKSRGRVHPVRLNVPVRFKLP